MVVYWDLGLGFVFGRNRQLLTVQGGDESGRTISELGHISIAANGPAWRCGEKGCLEAYAGGWVLLERFAQQAATLEELVALGEAGDANLLKAIREICALLGQHLAGAIQMFGVTEVRITGPLAPLFLHGQTQFMKGLADVVGKPRAAHMHVEVTLDAKARLLEGATRAARRAYLYPDEFNRLSRVSTTLQGQALAESQAGA